MSKAKKLVTGSLLRTAEFVATAIIGLMLMPFIIHSLGDKMYGLWIFVGSFLGYYNLMDFGIGIAVQRFCAKSIALEDYEDTNLILNTAFNLFLAIGAVALMVSAGIAIFVPIVMPNIVEREMFSKVVFILGLNFALGLPLRVFAGILMANLRHDINTIIEMVKLAVRTVLIMVLLNEGLGIIALAFITSVVDVGGYLAKFFISRYLYPYTKIKLFRFDTTKVKALLNYSYVTFVVQVTNQLRHNVDNLVIVACVGMNSVTMYSIGARLVRYYMDFILSAISLTTPLFSGYEATGDIRSMQSAYLFITKLSSYVSILVGGTLVIFGEVFILRWMGEAYIDAYVIMLILLLPTILAFMQSTSINLLYGISKHRYYAITNTIEGVANLVISIILARKYGIYGVAMGTAIPMLIIKMFVQPIYSCKAIQIPYRKYYLSLMLPVICLSTAILGGFWGLMRGFIVPEYASIGALAAVECIVFCLGVWFFGFEQREKEFLRSALMKSSLKPSSFSA